MDNVEVLVIEWLATIMPGVPISGDLPETRPDEFITVDRTGGPREAMVLDRATILVEVYNRNSRLDASQMAQQIADQIRGLETYNQNITHADVNSLVSLDDIIGGFKRYQIYCDVYHRR